MSPCEEKQHMQKNKYWPGTLRSTGLDRDCVSHLALSPEIIVIQGQRT